MDTTRLDTLLSFLKDDGSDTFVIFALAKEYEKHKLYKEALNTYLRLKEVDKLYIGLYYHLGALYLILGEMDDAIETYEEGIEVAKKLADFHALSELHSALASIREG